MSTGQISTMDERSVEWVFGVGRNRMSWFARPVHWMSEEIMRPWDGSSSWTEKAHYFAVGPLRFWMVPKLRSTLTISRLAERYQAPPPGHVWLREGSPGSRRYG